MDIELRDVDSESKRQNGPHATDLSGSYDRDAATLARMGKKQVLKVSFSPCFTAFQRAKSMLTFQ